MCQILVSSSLFLHQATAVLSAPALKKKIKLFMCYFFLSKIEKKIILWVADIQIPDMTGGLFVMSVMSGFLSNA